MEHGMDGRAKLSYRKYQGSEMRYIESITMGAFISRCMGRNTIRKLGSKKFVGVERKTVVN
jgi:hypothetical protein